MGSTLEQRFPVDRARHADAVQYRARSRGGDQGGRVRTPARHCRRGADDVGDGGARADTFVWPLPARCTFRGLPSRTRAADAGACARGRAGRRSSIVRHGRGRLALDGRSHRRRAHQSRRWRGTHGRRIRGLRRHLVEDIVRGLGIRIPMQAGKGYSLTMESPAPLPRICAILSEARVAMTPMGGALRFGGTMELAGIDESINPVRVSRHRQLGRTILSGLHAAHFDRRPCARGLRPCSPDGLPYIGALLAIRQPLARHRPRDDGHEPRTDHRQADGRDPVRRAASCNMDGLSPDRYA